LAKTEKPQRRAIALGQTAMATIVEPETGVDIAKGFRLTVNGLHIGGQPSFAASCSVLETLRVAERASGFAIGDGVLYLEKRFGEQAAQYIDSENFNEGTLKTYRWLAESIPIGRRRMDRLGIRHHLAVAGLPPAKQSEWLNKAADSEDDPWTVQRFEQALKDGGDAPVTGWWLVVAAESQEDLVRLQTELENKGRVCKPALKRRKRKAIES
jgi:hypothetical protein